ncbi:MAG: aminotransferase class III-fold pyridoxal phosphate-dependent enzyme [Burkholderiaceae bacterium]
MGQGTENDAQLNRPLASFDASRAAIAEAGRRLPGGVSSNFRYGIAPTPLVFERADGPWLFDIDGNRLIDYYLGMGPMILGHTPPAVLDAVREQLGRGILYGGQSRLEARAAELFCELVPCAEKLRFTSSGSEAVQAALALARAATGRHTVIDFEGHYHGWIPAGEVELLCWNDLAALETRLARGDVAAVIMEPAMCNAGAIHPAPGYLEGARAACSRHGTLLVFDEVITGFRLAPGGAQQLFGVTPDLATFGKCVASGFPVAAVAGRADLLDLFVSGNALHGGTYNANPASMAAALATLQALADGSVLQSIAPRGERLMQGLGQALREAGITAVVAGFPQIFHVGFGLTEPARDHRDLARLDRARYVRFCCELLARRVRALERGAWFLSAVHDDAVIEATIDAAFEAARAVAAEAG